MNEEYHVNFWGSHPDEENDDCWSGEDFYSKEEALICFNKDSEIGIAYIQIEGPDVYEVRKNPMFSPSKDDDDDWRRENAMQAGMAFGCAGYNDAMGYDMNAPFNDGDIMSGYGDNE